MDLLSCLQETGYVASVGLLQVKNDGHTCKRVVSEWRMRRGSFLALSQSMDHSDLFSSKKQFLGCTTRNLYMFGQ
jgi:hypothetical protein